METKLQEATSSEVLKTEPAWINDIPVGKLSEWRRHIHQNPELSFFEYNTFQYVTGILKSMKNIEVSNPAATSVLGILRGAKPGKTVVFRADMDALPVPEETGLPYSSVVKDVSHACGHDFHTAMLLGCATVLSEMKEDIAGTVYFLFQHAEEKYPGGAQEIVQSGVLKGADAFFGLHIIPNIPLGCVAMLPAGPVSMACDEFILTVFGKGSHGAMPQLSIDPIVIGSEIVTSLQTIVSRNVPPGDPAVISVGKFQSGLTSNVIPDKVEMEATVRSVSDTTRNLLEERIKAIIEHIVKAHGATYTLDYNHSYPAIQNDPGLVSLAKGSVTKILGQDNVIDYPLIPASEDFSYYRQVAPECFVLLGSGPGATSHNPEFNPDEGALLIGVKTEVQIILDYLNQE